MRQSKTALPRARDPFQDQLIQGSKDAIERSRELLRRTERLVRPGMPIVSAQPSDEAPNPESNPGNVKEFPFGVA